MRLIVGLGNPGAQYENTPHNVGFHAIETLGQRHGAQWTIERRFDAMTASIQIAGQKLTLMKPLTYMNLSGRAVAAWRSKNGGEPGEILALSDDVHLPMGQLRLRPDGSHGGQKGLLSLISTLGTLEFPRLRIGVRPSGGAISDMSSYVLGRVRPVDRPAFEQSWDTAADCVEDIIQGNFEHAMNRYNRKAP